MTIRGWLASCTVALVLAFPGDAGAQQRPEDVAQAYFAHFRAGEMDRVAALMHPRALESFKAFMMQMADAQDFAETPLGEVEDPARIPADSFFLAFTGEWGGQDEFDDVFRTLEVQPLGHVLQGDSLAHVVYSASMAFMNHQAQQTTVLTLRRHGRDWRVDPGDGMMAMMGGGLMMLMMQAGMQAGISGMGMGEGDDHDDEPDEDDDSDPPST